jgi:hypothetical protein
MRKIGGIRQRKYIGRLTVPDWPLQFAVDFFSQTAVNCRQVTVSPGIHGLEMFAHSADGSDQSAAKTIDSGMIRRVLPIKMTFQIGHDVESDTILLQNLAKGGIGSAHQSVRGEKTGQPMTPGVNNDHFSLILHFDDGHHLHADIPLVLTDSVAARKNFSQ